MASLAGGGAGYTPMEKIPGMVKECQDMMKSGITLDLKWRKRQLVNLYKMVEENQDDFMEALQKKFLTRSKGETKLTEIIVTMKEIAETCNTLEDLAKPRLQPKDLATIGDSCFLTPHPLGTVLIIAPWNFPVGLCLQPLAGVIAAGCTAIIKPSEVHEPVSELIARLLPRYLDNRCFKVVQGGIPETTALLKEKYELIFYTGNPFVARIVMKAAAQHLTPVILELGGKNPVVIDDEHPDLKTMAQRILFGRTCINAGQLCIAPEYVLCSEKVAPALVDAMKDAAKLFWPDGPQKSNDFGRIVNDSHFKRLADTLADIPKDKIVMGGDTDASERYIAPTIVMDPDEESKLMQNETFGPIMAIKPMKDFSIENVHKYIHKREKSLCAYFFSTNKKWLEKATAGVDAGGICWNDVCSHAMTSLPFGGVGESGMGAYHGHYNFTAFSHMKPVCYRDTKDEPLMAWLKYPPITEGAEKIFALLLLAVPEEMWPAWKKILFGNTFRTERKAVMLALFALAFMNFAGLTKTTIIALLMGGIGTKFFL